MNYSKYAIAIISSIALYACVSPNNFTLRYDHTLANANSAIRTDGYYVSQRECDSAFYTIFMFYSDGLFTIATSSKLDPELISCFTKGGKSRLSSYPQWGTYQLTNDTIRTQSVRTDEQDCVFFREYKILADGQLLNISDYVQAEYSRLGFMKIYPSFYTNECAIPATFYPTETLRPSSECPFLGKKWFEKK